MNEQKSMLLWTTETRKIKDLKNHEKNPRKISQDDFSNLKRSIAKFNYVEMVVINTDNTILAGHMRVRALKALGRGDETIEVRVPSRPLTDEEADEYLIRSNKNTGEWDFDKLANNFEIPDLFEWGFTEQELSIKNPFEDESEDEEQDEEDDEEEVEESEEDCKLKPGDVVKLGEHMLICGSSDILFCGSVIKLYKKYKEINNEICKVRINDEEI